MSIFNFSDIFGISSARNESAATAKKRLRLVLETSGGDKRNQFVEQLRADILQVIAKYANVSADDIAVSVDKQDEGKSVLELSVNFSEVELVSES